MDPRATTPTTTDARAADAWLAVDGIDTELGSPELGEAIARGFAAGRGAPLSASERDELERGLSFLDIPNHIYDWYSEQSLEVGPDDARARMRAFEAWFPAISALFAHTEPYVDSGQPPQQCTHLLGAYVIASQFMWHWYGFEAAEVHLARARAAAASTTVGGAPGADPIVPHTRLADIPRGGAKVEPTHRYYHDPRPYHVNDFWLARLLEARGDAARAVRHYEAFVALEPAFSPANDLPRNRHFYSQRHYVPSTTEALARAAALVAELGDDARADELLARAASLPATHQTPLFEHGARLIARGQTEAGLRSQAKHFETCVAYDKRGRNWLPFELAPFARRYVDWLLRAPLSADLRRPHVNRLSALLRRNNACVRGDARAELGDGLTVLADFLRSQGLRREGQTVARVRAVVVGEPG